MSSQEQEPAQPIRPYSIDLSLELERQLDNESPPSTPPPTVRPASMDQVVLASLVQQLQREVESLTKERDKLQEQFAQSESEKHGLQETLDQLSMKYEKTKEELEHANEKMQDDEHAISMLRTKVEESRRGLMRLQTENRRMSQGPMSIDLSRAGIPAFGGPSSSKRASFTPLTGTGATRMNGHKRTPSVSDTGVLLPNTGIPDNSLIPSPNIQTTYLSDTQSTTSSHPPVSANRFSGLFGRPSPPQSLELPSHDSLLEELEALRKEVKATKAELEDTRHELLEANESREASEACAKALRDFIGETKSVKLPPMPTMTTGEEADTTKKSVSGWGAFRMWKMEPAVKIEGSSSGMSATLPSAGARRLWSIDTAAKVPLNGAPASTPPSLMRSGSISSVAPFATKVGSFFGSRGSISSIASSALPTPQQPTSREPSYTNSDVSSIGESVVEPISPAMEAPTAIVMVRDTSASLAEDTLPEPVKAALQKTGTDVDNILPIPES